VKKVFERPRSLADIPFHYCPGCTHGIIHRLVATAIDDLGIQEQTIGVASVGCSVFTYNYFDVDMQAASHGRAPAVATGVKRAIPEAIVFAYQGDGDLASIGTAEFVHAAARGEKITIIFVNNAIYAMTGGQMAPTTLLGQKTTTSPAGRSIDREGYPVQVCEMLASFPGVAYLERVSVHEPRAVRRAQRAITNAFKAQQAGLGFSLIEVLSTCSVNWQMSPLKALEWLKENMLEYYPAKNFVNKLEQGGDGRCCMR